MLLQPPLLFNFLFLHIFREGGRGPLIERRRARIPSWMEGGRVSLMEAGKVLGSELARLHRRQRFLVVAVSQAVVQESVVWMRGLRKVRND